jgi:SM-20-related protein
MPNVIDWLTVEDFLDSPTRTELLSELRQTDAAQAGVYGGGVARVDKSVRSVGILRIGGAWRERVKALLADARPGIAGHFGVTLTTIDEPQFLRYEPGDFFVPHQDGNTPLIRDDSRYRLISVVIFLNPTSEEPSEDSYSGGSFVFHGQDADWEKRYVVPPAPGSLIAFRSETTHEVTPVTHGSRYSIVSWYR